jgi:hypothetical protein
MATYNNPRRIYYDKVIEEGTVTARNLCLVYDNPNYPGSGSKFLTKTLNLDVKGVKLSLNLAGTVMTMVHTDTDITNPTVTSTINFETSTNDGDIKGGKLEYTCGSDVNIRLNGETTGDFYDLELGVDAEFHICSIGTDDIRFRIGGNVTNYGQIYLLQDQEMFLQLQDISESVDKNLLIEYKSM